MMARKKRLTVTVDANLVEAASEAVAAGRAPSLSAWVNNALATQAAHDRRHRNLAAALADYEAEFGEIADDEMAAQQRRDREAAVVVRGRRAPRSRQPARSTKPGAA